MRSIPDTATAVNLLEFIYDILIVVKSQPDSQVPKSPIRSRRAWQCSPSSVASYKQVQ